MIERKRKQLAKNMLAHHTMIKEFIRMYNMMCPICKAKAAKNPDAKLSEYCPGCQAMMSEILTAARDKLNA